MRRLGADDPAPAITTPQWLPGPLEAANYSVAELLGDAEGFGWSLRVDEIRGATQETESVRPYTSAAAADAPNVIRQRKSRLRRT